MGAAPARRAAAALVEDGSRSAVDDGPRGILRVTAPGGPAQLGRSATEEVDVREEGLQVGRREGLPRSSQGDGREGEYGANAPLSGRLQEVHGGWSGIPNVRGQIEGGLLRALCVSILVRSESLPKVPTCDELGVKGFDIATMLGLLAPAGTPPAVLATLQAETAKALRDPKIAERMVQLGVVMQEAGTAHYQKYVRDDMARYAAIVKRLNLQIK